MLTLGINAAFHDPAACLVRDGRIVAASEEERFTRIKHGKRPVPFSTWELPFHAVDSCLRTAGVRLADVDQVAYSYDPWSRVRPDALLTLPLEPSAHPTPEQWDSVWDPLFLSSIVNAPRHLVDGWPHHLQKRLRTSPDERRWHWHWVPHHLAHAASAFYPSPFAQAAIMTLDGRGETATTTYGVGRGNRMDLIGQVHMPHSLGMLYERMTTYLGFLHSSDEYKVMAMASYGKPRHVEALRPLIRHGERGSYEIVPFTFEELFGPARRPGTPFEERHFDIARSVQAVLEETALKLAHWLHATTGERRLVLAGGVALNCVMNARLRDEGPFDDIWVQPAAGDAGTALGAALWIDLKERGAMGDERGEARPSRMEHAYLGPAYDDAEIEATLQRAKLSYRRADDLAEEAAALLARNKILGWFQGRMEFGPRALGARSILASPLDPGMQARLNELKDREDFRPVAPVVLEEKAAAWFKDARPEPFMLFVNEVLPEAGRRIPAVRHVDGTARIQTVRREQNPRYYDLLAAFERRTGVPVLVNTSFNTRGEPVVCSPHDALESFWTTPLDALAIGSFLVEKPG